MSSDIPPSYGSAEQLPQYETDVPVFNAQIPAMTAEQRVAFEKAVAKTMTSPDAAEYLKAAAAAASNACNATAAMFINLMNELAKIDAKNMPPEEGPFVPRFKDLSQEYHRIVHKSRDLAVEIAVYGQRFDTIIVPFCNDKSLMTTKRLAKVTEFINDSCAFSKDSDSIKASFEKLEAALSKFICSFTSVKEGKSTEKLEQAGKVTEKVEKNIPKQEDSFTLVDVVTLGSRLVIGILACLPISFVSFVIARATAIAGLGSTAVSAIEIDSKNDQVKAKQARIGTLVQATSDIKETREKLKKLNTENLELLKINISLIALLWRSVHNHASEIKTWLEGGAKDADMPEYMIDSPNEAVYIFKTMAVYLRQYADGVASVNVSNPSLS